MKYSIGIVGAGLIGRKRAQSLTKNQKLLGVFDLNTELAKQFGNDFSCRVFESLESLLEALNPASLLIVATNHSALAGIAQFALDAKLNVLVEKPGARNLEEFKPLVETAKKNNVLLRVGYNHRFHPAICELKKNADSGEFGPIQLIRARYGHGGRIGYESEWRANKNLSGGGELLDQGSHLIDLVHYFDSKIRVQNADTPTLYWNMEVEDNAFISGKTENGAKIWLHASWTEWKNLFSFEVFFKTAKFEVIGLGGSYGVEKIIKYHMEQGLGIPTMSEITFEGSDDSWKLEMQDIDQEINGAKPVGSSGTDAQNVLEIIGKIYAHDYH